MSLDDNTSKIAAILAKANAFTLIYIRTDQKDETINYYKKV